MPVVAADLKTAELVIRGIASAEGGRSIPTVNLFHFRRTATVNDVVKANVITGFHDNVATTVLAALNHSWTMESIDCRMLEDVTDPYLTVTYVGAVGAIAGERLNTRNAAYLLKRTAKRGRRFRGSLHFSPMSESDTGLIAGNESDDIWLAATIARLEDIADAIMAGFASAEGNNWVPVLWSRLDSDLTTVPATIATTDLSQILVRKSIGLMKRRNAGSVY